MIGFAVEEDTSLSLSMNASPHSVATSDRDFDRATAKIDLWVSDPFIQGKSWFHNRVSCSGGCDTILLR
jgi:hypothetical protein